MICIEHNDDKNYNLYSCFAFSIIYCIPPCNDEQQHNINIPLTMNQYVLYP